MNEFGKIIYMSNSQAHISMNGTVMTSNLMNMHVVFESDNKKILGEIEDISKDLMKVHFLGEIVDNHFFGGVIRKPNLDSKIRLISKEELSLLTGMKKEDNMLLGTSPLYDDISIYANMNDLFSNHMAIFGNTGSGKSWGVARLIQNLFSSPTYIPYKANIFLFDAYGEYHNAFQHLHNINPNYNFKFYTTNVLQTTNGEGGELLRIPLWLLSLDDIALLLNANSHSQLPILERMLTLTKIFAETTEEARKYKNHLIAKAIMTILYTNQTASAKRNDIFSIFATCSTPEFNLEAPVQGLGYVRKFRECFLIDKEGNFTESILVTEYVSKFIDESLDQYEPKTKNPYSLKDMEKAFHFTLISEGLLHNEKLYNEAVTLKVRLHSIAIGEYAKFFDFPTYVTLEQYLSHLVSYQGKKAQIINFNLEDIEDSMAKTIVKIFSRMLFDFTKNLKQRATIPFHIFLEEAHRYVQEDNDKFLLGYNIFERIAKEGRKYGLILDLISQRPVDLSDTVMAQMGSFIIFKMTHPRDLEYITKMLPNISEEIVEKQKTLQPGTCVAFGRAFKIPLIIRMEKPNPIPESTNCDVYQVWGVRQNPVSSSTN